MSDILSKSLEEYEADYYYAGDADEGSISDLRARRAAESLQVTAIVVIANALERIAAVMEANTRDKQAAIEASELRAEYRAKAAPAQ